MSNQPDLGLSDLDQRINFSDNSILVATVFVLFGICTIKKAEITPHPVRCDGLVARDSGSGHACSFVFTPNFFSALKMSQHGFAQGEELPAVLG